MTRAAALACAAALLTVTIARPAAAAPPPAAAAAPIPADFVAVRNADGWLAQPGGPQRDRIVRDWIPAATLPEAMWLLRREPAQLGALELPLVERALALVPAEREALGRRLLARLVTADPAGARKRFGALAGVVAAAPLAPRASVFRVGLLAPGAGADAGPARALGAGLAAGLAAAGAGFPVEILACDTGDDAARTTAALDSAAARAGVLVAGTSEPDTRAIAVAARMLGTPLVAPLAGAANDGADPSVLQAGPSGWERGLALASHLDLRGLKLAVLTSSATPASFGDGLGEAARRAGATIVWRATYAAGAIAYAAEVHELGERRPDLLVWDGEPREADALLRQLARARLALRIAGGAGLAPEAHHPELRPLLERAVYVSDEWTPRDTLAAALDRAGGAGAHADPAFVRGWLAGRAIRGAIDAGALCPEELAGRLAPRGADAWAASHGFLAPGPGVTLPVFVVRGGRSTALPQP